jgi:hypothetical protein
MKRIPIPGSLGCTVFRPRCAEDLQEAESLSQVDRKKSAQRLTNSTSFRARGHLV